MKLVGFLGACDKANLIMYLAKILTWNNEKVLVIDGTRLQKMKYLVPNINPEGPYITDFEQIDFAVGFGSMQLLEKYLGADIERSKYSCVLVDTDTARAFVNFDLQKSDKNFFMTTFDLYSLKRGLEIINAFKEPLDLTKIISRYQVLKNDEEYFNYLAMESKANWGETSIYLPNDSSDIQEFEENQRISRIKVKRLSNEYQNGLVVITQEILGEQNKSKIKKSIRA